MDYETQLKLQAFLDGELPEKEARDMAALVARDSEATDLLTELRNTRKALADFEVIQKLPESREFYWSKIQRQIERLEPEPKAAESVSLLVRLRRILVPLSAAAVLAIAVVIAGRGPSVGPDTETTTADSSTFTYQDDANGTTLVWLSYPAER